MENFKALAGCPIVIHTSFNVQGEPIVNSPGEAYTCFMNTEMDSLVINNLVFSKQSQTGWKHDQYPVKGLAND